MSEHLLFLTGKLAEKRLHQILEEIQPTEFTYTVHQLGITVAALMTADMILRRLKDTFGADRVIVPGRCRGDLDALSTALGISFTRGPDELKDLPNFFGRKAIIPDLSQYKIKIFAEITDAPMMSIETVLQQAANYKKNGADIIDIGCLPDTPFPHLEETVQALKQQGYIISIDSLDPDDLLRGSRAGADYMLSLNEETLWVIEKAGSIPILIPHPHGDLDALDRTIEGLLTRGCDDFILDPILDPIHFGLVDSISRYREVRHRHPEAEMLMGVGNLTELTHADTMGMNALLLGLCSELEINAILTTQVSKHARQAVREANLVRRIMYAAKNSDSLPKHIDNGLMALHETNPFPDELNEIQELASQIRDPSYRIQVSSEGLHIFNRDGFHTATDPFDLFPKLGVENDGSHAFYLGVQLGRAQIAHQLGKRFVQDEPLNWGCAVEKKPENLNQQKKAGSTLKKPKPKTSE
ncbi:MAG: DUF6513 domain-containing protein [Methylococcales bacterium]